MTALHRHAPLALVCLAVFTASIWWNPVLNSTDDDARMILEARTLWSRGEWPEHNNHLGMVVLLAPFAGSMVLMHLLAAGCFVASVVLVLYVSPQRTLGIVAASATALSPLLLDYSCQIMTEVPYLCVSLGALALAQRRRWGPAIGLALISITLRPVGVTLAAAVGLEYLLEERGRRTALAFAVLTFCAAVFLGHMTGRLHAGVLTQGSPYTPPIGWTEFPGRLWGNLGLYTVEYIPFAFVAQMGSWLWVGVATLVVAVAGLVQMRSRPLSVYLAGYLAALLVWPEEVSGSRYVVPAVPLLLVAAVYMCRQSVLSRIAVGALAVASLHITVMRAQGAPYVLPGCADYFSVAASLSRLPPGSVVACRKTSAMEVLSGHTAKMFPFVDPDSVRAWIKGEGVTHVVIDQMGMAQTQRHLVPAVWDAERRRPRPGFRLIANTKTVPATVVLRVER